VPIVVAIIGVIALLISLLGSSTEFRLVDGALRIIESLGPMRWSWDCRLAGIQKLTIKHLFVAGRQESAPPPKADDRAVLFIQCRGRPEIQCAHGYRRQQLVGVAEQLANLCAEFSAVEEQAVRKVAVVEEDEATLFKENSEQPAGSRTIREEHQDGVTLHVPPQGVRRTSLLLSPGIAAIAIHFGIMFALALPNPNFFDFFSMLAGLTTLFGFVWMMAARARRQAVFAVIDTRLLVLETTLFGSKRSEWDRSELYDVRSGEAFKNSRKTKMFELQVWKRDGKKVVFLKGRDEAEMRWMATVLRHALHLPLQRQELVEASARADAS
jgi:hypothetical protein